MSEEKKKEKLNLKVIKDKVISAFGLFFLFCAVIAIICIGGYFFEDAKTVDTFNARFSSLGSTRVSTYYVTVYEEVETNDLWISVNTQNNAIDNSASTESQLIRVNCDSRDDFSISYDEYSDCLIIKNTTCNEKYIYFKDSKTLSYY